jgi:hypothetical protein
MKNNYTKPPTMSLLHTPISLTMHVAIAEKAKMATIVAVTRQYNNQGRIYSHNIIYEIFLSDLKEIFLK